jgi:hypothetical protein
MMAIYWRRGWTSSGNSIPQASRIGLVMSLSENGIQGCDFSTHLLTHILSSCKSSQDSKFCIRSGFSYISSDIGISRSTLIIRSSGRTVRNQKDTYTYREKDPIAGASLATRLLVFKSVRFFKLSSVLNFRKRRDHGLVFQQGGATLQAKPVILYASAE